MMSMVGDGMDVAVGAARARVGLAGSAGEGGASGAGAAVWPPAIVNDARRAIYVAFNLVALFMRQHLFGSWPKVTRQSCFWIANASVIMAARRAFKFVGDNKVCLSTTIANNALAQSDSLG
jgi:hypothetical protein